MTHPDPAPAPALAFRAGLMGAILPLVTFLAGVAALGLAGAPDERGFWPVLLGALGTGLILCRDRTGYAEAVVRGMSRPIVMLMVLAWLLAGVLGSVIGASGFVEALVTVAAGAGVSGGGYVLAAFLIAAAVSTSTGTSLGTLIIVAPLLYPAAAPLGADPVWLIGAILGGATFGDNISPVSDTTIASAATQEADIGGVVKSRLRYAIPAAVVAGAGFLLLGASGEPGGGQVSGGGSTLPLLMLAAPALTIGLLLRRAHLLTALLAGILAGLIIALGAGLFDIADVVRIDRDAFVATGLVFEGMERGIGISIFTLLLMGLVGGLEAGGVMDRLLGRAASRASTPARTEWSIFGAVSGAVLLTTHSVVAILAVGPLARAVGPDFGISRFRRANLLDVTVCTYPFLLPFFIPTILAASLTGSGAEAGVVRVTALEAGLANLHSWGLLAVLLLSLATGRGRSSG